MLPGSQSIVLGSRSPRRMELLRLLVPAERITVVAPRATEAGFDSLHDWPSIEQRLREITRRKTADVLEQLASSESRIPITEFPLLPRPLVPDPRPLPESPASSPLVITADTIIVASEPDGRLVVLGQPPDDDTWPDVVRGWFRRYYFGKMHTAATCVRVGKIGAAFAERVVTTRVTFSSDGEQWLDWYLATGEPVGKAGGYALQGAAGLFIDRVEGSLSNVVGLPLREVREMLARAEGT